MPGTDGLELYRRIRQLRPSVVGVFVTAFAASSMMDEARSVGVRKSLPKPRRAEENVDRHFFAFVFVGRR